MRRSFILDSRKVDIESPILTKKDRLIYAKEQMLSTFKKVIPYILIGVDRAIITTGSLRNGWQQCSAGKNPYGVILAALIGVPMYADIFVRFPIAEALYL
jgi:uncharacterized membrane protein YraQ (UPF0718 family)